MIYKYYTQLCKNMNIEQYKYTNMDIKLDILPIGDCYKCTIEPCVCPTIYGVYGNNIHSYKKILDPNPNSYLYNYSKPMKPTEILRWLKYNDCHIAEKFKLNFENRIWSKR